MGGGTLKRFIGFGDLRRATRLEARPLFSIWGPIAGSRLSCTTFEALKLNQLHVLKMSVRHRAGGGRARKGGGGGPLPAGRHSNKDIK